MVILRVGEFLSVVIHSVSETLTKRPTSFEYFTTQSRNCFSSFEDLDMAAVSSG